MKHISVFLVVLLLIFAIIASPQHADLSTVWGIEKGSKVTYDRTELLNYPFSWNIQNQVLISPFNITFLELSEDGYRFQFQDSHNKTIGITLFKDFQFFGIEGILPLIGYPFLLPLAIYNENDYVSYYFEQWKTFAEFLQSQQTTPNENNDTSPFKLITARTATLETLDFTFYMPNITLSSIPHDTFFGNFSLSSLNLTQVSPFNTNLTLFTNVTTTYRIAYEINTGLLVTSEFILNAKGWKLITQENDTREPFFQYLVFKKSPKSNAGHVLDTYSFGYIPLYLTLTLIILPCSYYAYKFIRKR